MIQGLQFVVINVRDMATERDFYTEKLGLELEAQSPAFIQFKQGSAGGATFALQASETPAPSAQTELWWFVDDVDKTYAELVARHVSVQTPPHDEPFGRAMSLQDPEGNIVNLLQAR